MDLLKRIAIAGISGLMVIGLLSAQQASEEFDAASVKVNRSVSDSSSTAFSPGGGFTARAATLRELIQEAYRVKDDRLIGGPDWVGSERYDIAAKPAGPVSDEQARSMLRNLLADRFQLRVRQETRQVDVYALMVGKNGPKLTEASDSNCVPRANGPPVGPPPKMGTCGGSDLSYGQLRSRGVSMQRFAGTLSEAMDRPVVDMTYL